MSIQFQKQMTGLFIKISQRILRNLMQGKIIDTVPFRLSRVQNHVVQRAHILAFPETLGIFLD